MNNNYWFYLEPFTFIFSDLDDVLLYNSFGKSLLKFKLTERIKAIIKSLNKSQHMYIISLSDKDLLHVDVKNFVDGVRNSFSGDLISQALIKNKPVIMPPIFNLQTFDDNLTKDPEFITEKNPSTQHLNELTIYITGKCTQSCKYCPHYRSQFTFCHKRDQSLGIDAIDKTLKQISDKGLQKINICGGDIFSYEQFDKLLELMENNNYQKTFFSHYLNVNLKFTLQILKLENTVFEILVNFPIEEKRIEEILTKLENKKEFIKWIFILGSKEEYDKVEKIVSQKKINNYSLKPFFTSINFLFFEENVFLNEEDICNADISRNEIFARKVMNTFDFGKLIINEDGQIFANQNHKPLGIIGDNLINISLMEIDRGKSWKRTRLKIKPCKDCIYNLLCPSPSNYELVIGKNNLCSVWSYHK